MSREGLEQAESSASDTPSDGASVDEIELKLLLEAIFLRYHYDFRHYSRTSIRRRLDHAMIRFHCQSVGELQGRVLRDPVLFTQLRDELTVQVSEMFRDPLYFRALRDQILPWLETYPNIRLWVAGCSTGEEVWSLAILLHEAGLLDRCRIYATDINTTALNAAKRGIYSQERVAEFSRSYQRAGGTGSLSDYYTAAYGGVVFDRALIRDVVFSDHDLATDSAFAEVQLISCRNVLIYFDRSLQERVFSMFAASLCPKGFLGLGSHESVQFSTEAACFSEFVGEQKLYRKFS